MANVLESDITANHSQAVLPNPVTLVLEGIDRCDDDFRMCVRARQPSVCPDCGHISTSRHSRYSRRLNDLPWQGRSVQIWLRVGRYRCRNEQCLRKIFCERMPGVAPVSPAKHLVWQRSSDWLDT
ncbi:MAG: transposase [Bryobacteraceae bacterium]|nr:transposase [Bryobacteraceae bacterium]